MDVKRIGHASIGGWKEKAVRRVEEPLARRTPLTADQIRAAAGLYLLLRAVKTVTSATRAALRG
jgi:hypothetical protein